MTHAVVVLLFSYMSHNFIFEYLEYLEHVEHFKSLDIPTDTKDTFNIYIIYQRHTANTFLKVNKILRNILKYVLA